jgi:hypothetical protein
MRNYAVGLSAVLIAISGVGVWPLAAGLAAIVSAASLLLFRSYRRWMSGAPSPGHRADLDRLILRQWVATGVIGLASAAVSVLTGAPVLKDGAGAQVAQALFGAAGIALTGVFVSSLVDWYWILPRVGGLGNHLAPCEDPGERWKYVTSIWLFHRAVATLLVVASITAVPIYLAATLDGSAAKTGLGLLGLVIGGSMAAINQRGLTTLFTAFNQSIYVGDTILVSRAGDDEGAPTRRHRAYVVDVSIQGLKYQFLDGNDFNGPRFERRGHGPVLGGDEYRAIDRVKGPLAVPCREGRSGVNWYCRNNTHAYDY